MTFDVLTIFPQMISPPLKESVLGKAIERGVVTVNVVDVRDFATDRHRVTDDYPYGGGGGMVMKPEPLVRAIRSVLRQDPRAWIVLLTPQGVGFDQRVARRLSGMRRIALVCGRYEGVDERVRGYANEEISVGDYVLSGGEVAALVVIEAVSRLVPGVLGCPSSPDEESFSHGLLEHPQYTRPSIFEGREVPEVLLSGDHGKIRRWRRQQALLRTWIRRPELLAQAELTEEDRAFLAELEHGG